MRKGGDYTSASFLETKRLCAQAVTGAPAGLTTFRPGDGEAGPSHIKYPTHRRGWRNKGYCQPITRNSWGRGREGKCTHWLRVLDQRWLAIRGHGSRAIRISVPSFAHGPKRYFTFSLLHKVCPDTETVPGSRVSSGACVLPPPGQEGHVVCIAVPCTPRTPASAWQLLLFRRR